MKMVVSSPEIRPPMATTATMPTTIKPRLSVIWLPRWSRSRRRRWATARRCSDEREGIGAGTARATSAIVCPFISERLAHGRDYFPNNNWGRGANRKANSTGAMKTRLGTISAI